MAEVYKQKTISSFQIKADTGDELIITGWGAKYGNEDSYKDILEPGCAKKTLEEAKDRIAFCDQHDMRKPVGKFLVLEERMEGIYFEVRISDSEPKIKTKIREGILKEFSIGYSELRAEYNSETHINLVKEIKLYEISVVTRAANDQAILTSMKAEEKAGVLTSSFNNILGMIKDETIKHELLKLKEKALEAIAPPKALDDDTPPKELNISIPQFNLN